MGNKQSQVQSQAQNKEYLQILQRLEQIVFDLGENNIKELVKSSLNFFDEEFPYSFNLVVCRLVYSYFTSHYQNANICFSYLKMLEEKEEEKINHPDFSNIIEIFAHFLISLETQESYYLLEKLIEQKFIEAKIVKNKPTLYFAHHQKKFDPNHLNSKYQFACKFCSNIEALKKDDWNLHRQLIQEGVNPSNIAKAIRNDDVEKLQEISSQADFNFNQIIEPSLYERCSFINKPNVSLIDYAAFFGSIKCFRFLLLNETKLNNTGKYAIAGGNLEIIHLCEQNNSLFEGLCEAAIEFHRNDIFHYLYENKIIEFKDFTKLGEQCIQCNNYELLGYLEKEGMEINYSIIEASTKIGNFPLVKYFVGIKIYTKYDLFLSVESGNFELVKYILERKRIDINFKDV